MICCAERIAAIKLEGAGVEGGYDDAIRRSAEVAGSNVLVVSDTSWEGYSEPPAWVIEGYSTMMAEERESIAAGTVEAPTLVAAQVGVRAFAAAVVRGFARPGEAAAHRRRADPGRLRDCEHRTRRAHRAPGSADLIMAGFNCGPLSQIAWPDPTQGFDAFATATDDDARAAMRLRAVDGVISGERGEGGGGSGAAGLAGLIVHREEPGLTTDAVVLVFSTEGVTDEAAYAQIINR